MPPSHRTNVSRSPHPLRRAQRSSHFLLGTQYDHQGYKNNRASGEKLDHLATSKVYVLSTGTKFQDLPNGKLQLQRVGKVILIGQMEN